MYFVNLLHSPDFPTTLYAQKSAIGRDIIKQIVILSKGVCACVEGSPPYSTTRACSRNLAASAYRLSFRPRARSVRVEESLNMPKASIILHSAFLIVEQLSNSLIWVTTAMLQPSKVRSNFGHGDRSIVIALSDDVVPK